MVWLKVWYCGQSSWHQVLESQVESFTTQIHAQNAQIDTTVTDQEIQRLLYG